MASFIFVWIREVDGKQNYLVNYVLPAYRSFEVPIPIILVHQAGSKHLLESEN